MPLRYRPKVRMPDIDKAERRADRIKMHLLANHIDPRQYRRGQRPLVFDTERPGKFGPPYTVFQNLDPPANGKASVAFWYRHGGDAL